MAREDYAQQVTQLVLATERVLRQNHGRKNNWAGTFLNCAECGELFAHGGNWSAHGEENFKTCPNCDLYSNYVLIRGKGLFDA